MERVVRFTFFSDGNSYNFNPNKVVYDPSAKRQRTLLELHKDEVAFRGSKSVFILDNYGKPLV